MAEEFIMTQEGYDEAKERLKYLQTEKKKEVLDAEIERMIEERQAARKAKNFALADEIRGRLLEMGIILEDTREGVKWKRA